MHLFFEDVRRRKAFLARLTGLAILALAIGMILPPVFSRVSAAFPAIAPFFGIEGDELGLGDILIPAGMASITLFCLVLEAYLIGYKDSSARKIILNETPSVRTDVFYTLLRISGFFMILAIIFSFGGLYIAVDYIKAEFAFAFLKFTDNILVQYAVLVVLMTFVNYWFHRLLHSKFLWEIHKVHHSAEDLNILLPYRNHPVDFILATLIGAAITTALGARPETTVLWLSTNSVYQSFVHSHFEWKWRWVDYLLITPATHRIHHSSAVKHYNANLGILSIWDRMFGTYVPPTKEAIEFGVPDPQNFNTDKFFSEMMGCLGRWIGLKRSSAG